MLQVGAVGEHRFTRLGDGDAALDGGGIAPAPAFGQGLLEGRRLQGGLEFAPLAHPTTEGHGPQSQLHAAGQAAAAQTAKDQQAAAQQGHQAFGALDVGHLVVGALVARGSEGLR